MAIEKLVFDLMVLFALLALSAFSSGAEIAFFSLSEMRMKKLVNRREKGVKELQKLKAHPHKYLVTVLIINDVVNILAAGYAAVIATEAFGSLGLGLATGVMTFLILVFGEIVPKAYCYKNAERIALAIAKPMLIVEDILSPVVVLVEYLSRGTLHLMGEKRRGEREITLEDVRAAISIGADAGLIDTTKKNMMDKIVGFGDMVVSEVMIPREKIVALSADTTLHNALAKMVETRYTRFPVYKGAFDNVIGIAHMKNALDHVHMQNMDVEVGQVTTPAIFVGKRKKVDDLLEDFRETGIHMAVVIDSGKKVEGIVTLEDLLEEIVGEIYDEGDTERTKIRFMDHKSAVVDGEIPLAELIEKLGLAKEYGRFETAAGLIRGKAKGEMKEGKKVRLRGFTFEIRHVKDGEIKRIRITKRRGSIRKRLP